jgi:hypothetical protein
MGVFSKYDDDMYPHKFAGRLIIGCIAGGTPTDRNVAEGWLKTKLGVDNDDLIREAVAKVMAETGVSVEEATQTVNAEKHLNAFKQLRCPKCEPDGPFCADGSHQLFIEGRQLKAGLKEAVSIAVAADKIPGRGWGLTNKGLLSYLSEHVFVLEDKLLLVDEAGNPIVEPTGVNQRFVHTYRGSGIQYEQYVEDAVIDFTVRSDHDFEDDEWATIWTTGEQQGLGASRSQGYGRYEVTRWDRVLPRPPKKTGLSPKTKAAAKARAAR